MKKVLDNILSCVMLLMESDTPTKFPKRTIAGMSTSRKNRNAVIYLVLQVNNGR